MTILSRYHVWCLSWDDEEDAGSDVVAYDILKHDYKTEERGVIYVPSFSLARPLDAAAAYAEYAHDHRDGYEATWPLLFRVRGPDGEISDFEVNREYVPKFTAHPIKRDEDSAA